MDLCYGAFVMTAGLHKNGGERGVWFDRDLQLDTAEHSRIINASNQQYLSAMYSDSGVFFVDICASYSQLLCSSHVPRIYLNSDFSAFSF